MFVTGLPVLAPTLREEYDLSIGQIGLLLAAAWVGSTLMLLPWGLAADRYGERVALAAGLGACALFLTAAAFVTTFWGLFLLLALAGASGSSVNSASGRAVMQWFGPSERGLALGVRQSAIPAGGLIGALVVPRLAAEGGSEPAFLFLAGFCAFGALVGAVVLRSGDSGDALDSASIGRTLGDRKLWRLSLGSGLYLYAQLALIGFDGPLPARRARRLRPAPRRSSSRAAQVLAVGLRIGVGQWSDVVGSRVGPLRLVGLAVTGSLLVTALLTGGPVWLLVVGARGCRRALDGMERAVVRCCGRAGRPAAQRRRDRLPADCALGDRGRCSAALRCDRKRPILAGGLRRRCHLSARGLARIASLSSAQVGSAGADCSSASSSCTRSGAGRARTACTARRPRTRPSSSPPTGCRRPVWRSRSTRTATCSGGLADVAASGRVPISTRCPRAVASTARSASSLGSRQWNG